MENNLEIKGYEWLYGTLKKIGRYFIGKSEKINFEKYKLLFGERDDDVYIATYPKSGTTLMQVILYQLTTEGNMDFNHIYEVSPWIRNHAYLDNSPQKLSSPRIIKTHDHYRSFNKDVKGRFIYVYRNGMDVAVSHYHQRKNYNQPDLSFENYLDKFFKNKAWFKHLKTWMRNKKNLNILYVCYEDLLNNKSQEIERICAFLKIKPCEDAVERALKYSSFDYMKKHETKFGDQPTQNKIVYNQFIRKGQAGEGKAKFSDEQTKIFEEYYDEIVKPYENEV